MGRSEPLQHDDPKATHGTEGLLDAARGRKRGRYASGGERLVRKQRLPPSKSHIARIAATERNELIAEVGRLRGDKGLSVLDYELVDSAYWATAALLTGYQHVEHNGLIDVEAHAYHPIVEQIGRLKRLKQAALEKLGVDEIPIRDLGFLDQPHVPSTTQTAPAADQCVSSVGVVSVDPDGEERTDGDARGSVPEE